MVLETVSTKNLAITFALLAAGVGIFIAVALFPATNLIRETVTAEGVVISSSNGECVVETPDGIPKNVENCDLAAGSNVTVRFQKGMYEAEIVPQT
jgi:hypothetical protein